MDHVEERAQPVDLVELAGERRRQIEAEAVDMHVHDPITQRIHHQLQRIRMPHVQAVARPREIDVLARVVGYEVIVGAVVDSLECEGGAEVVALRCVVVDDVENHLESRGVERPHHLLEFGDLILEGKARVGGEEADRVVAPVIREPAADEPPSADGVMNRQQLDTRHAEGAEMLDDRLGAEAEVGAAHVLWDSGMLDRHPLDMALVDHGLVPRNLRRAVTLPVERRIDHDALGHGAAGVAVVARQVLPGAAGGVAVHRIVPAHRPGDGPGVGVEDELGGIEAEALLRLVGAVDAVPVQLPGTGIGQIAVPNLIGLLSQRDELRLIRLMRGIEQAELDACALL